MKYMKYLLPLFLFLALVLTSCKDDDETLAVDEDWKKANAEAFTSKGFDSDFRKLNSASGDGYILYRVVEEGTDTRPIYYTSTVELQYRGCLIRDEEGNLIENLDEVLEKGAAFDENYRVGGDYTTEMSPSGLVDGFGTALQNMHVGDHWEVWIPYQLGYGVSGNSGGSVTILPYTTLVFEIKVIDITKE